MVRRAAWFFCVLLPAAPSCRKHEDESVEPVATRTTLVAATAPSDTAVALTPLFDAEAVAQPELDAAIAALRPPTTPGLFGMDPSSGAEPGGFAGGANVGPGQQAPVRAHLRQGQMSVRGRLPPEVVQRIVRQSFGRFRRCYTDGLAHNRGLAGTVSTSFIIGPQGDVTSVANDSRTTLPDPAVAGCVNRGFSSLSFPEPEGGIVTVVYPIIFSVEDDVPSSPGF